MSGKIAHRECPRCGGLASNNAGANFTHSAAHGIHHGFSHHNPMMLGLGVIAACAQVFKTVRFHCKDCGHAFFSR